MFFEEREELSSLCKPRREWTQDTKKSEPYLFVLGTFVYLFDYLLNYLLYPYLLPGASNNVLEVIMILLRRNSATNQYFGSSSTSHGFPLLAVILGIYAAFVIDGGGRIDI